MLEDIEGNCTTFESYKQSLKMEWRQDQWSPMLAKSKKH